MQQITTLVILAVIGSSVHGTPTSWDHKQGRMVGGEIADQKNYPFAAALYNPNFKQAAGSAVIIAPNWLLTTQDNCENVVPDTYAVVGTGDVTNGGTAYQMGESQNSRNACIIKLKNRISFSDKVDQIALPPYAYEWPEKTQGQIIGWGATSDNWAEVSSNLKVIGNMTSYPFNCPESHLGTDGAESKFCAESTKKGVTPCSGDGGAPLVYGKNVLMGLFYRYLPDATVQCSETKMSAYVKVAQVVGWLQNRMEDDAKYLKWANVADLP